MNKRKAITVLAIVAMILPMLEGLFSLSSSWRETVYAETNVENLISRDDIEVNYTYMEDETNSELVHWLITYKHDVAARQSDEVSASLRFKLASPLADGQRVDLSGSTFNAPVIGDLWYRQSEFTPQSQGTIKITSPKVIPVTLAFQMDTMSLVEEIVTEEVEKEVTVQVEEEIPAGESQQDPVTEENTEVAEGEGTPVVALAASTPQTRLVDKTEIVTETVETIVESEQLNVDVLEADLAVDHELDYSAHVPEETTAVEPEEEIVDEGEPVAENEEPVAEVENAEGDVTVPDADETVVAEEETVAEGEVGEKTVTELEEAELENQALDFSKVAHFNMRIGEDVSEDSFDIQTKKSATLATKDTSGNDLEPADAWAKRLYEITLQVSSVSVPGEVKGNLIIYVDSSGSFNGKNRKELVIKQVKAFVEYIHSSGGEINIAFVPTIQEEADIPKSFNKFHSTTELYENGTFSQLQSILGDAMQGSGKKSLAAPFNFAKNNGMLSTNPIGIAIGGTEFNDLGEAKQTGIAAQHSGFLGVLLDTTPSYGSWDSIVSGPEYLFGGGDTDEKKAAALKEAFEQIREIMTVGEVQIQDTISPYFTIVENSVKNDGVITGQSVQFSNQKMTKPENALPTDRYEWSTSFLIQANIDFAGGNVVPTNIPDTSNVIVGSGDSAVNYPFEIYGEGNELYDLLTPYVNVKMLPGVASSKQVILLGETAKTEVEIKADWSEGHDIGYVTTVDPEEEVTYYGVEPTIVIDGLSPSYTHQPTTAGEWEYSSEGTITAGFAEAKDSVAHDYADGYGATGDEVPNAVENIADFNGTHKLTVLATKFNIEKLLDNGALPTGFSANFTMNRVLQAGEFLIPSIESVTKQIHGPTDTMEANSQITFDDLGIGTYTLTEAMTLQGVKTPNPINILITRASSSTEANPIFSIVVGTTEYVVDGEVGVLEINNETKDIILDLLKKDSNTEKVIGGVKFKLTNNADDPRTNLLGVDNATDDTGKLSIPSGILKAGNTYTLVETTPKDGFIASPTEYEIAIDALGNISVTTNNVTYQHQTVDYESGSTIKVDLTIFNTRKGVLPATGGQGIQGYMMIALMLTVLTGGLFLVYVSRKRKGGM